MSDVERAGRVQDELRMGAKWVPRGFYVGSTRVLGGCMIGAVWAQDRTVWNQVWQEVGRMPAKKDGVGRVHTNVITYDAPMMGHVMFLLDTCRVGTRCCQQGVQHSNWVTIGSILDAHDRGIFRAGSLYSRQAPNGSVLCPATQLIDDLPTCTGDASTVGG